MFTASWSSEPWTNIEVNTVAHGEIAFAGAVPWVSACTTTPYLSTSRASGPLHSEPPWTIVSRYTTTFAMINASVTTGARSVGMLSLIGITRAQRIHAILRGSASESRASAGRRRLGAGQRPDGRDPPGLPLVPVEGQRPALGEVRGS